MGCVWWCGAKSDFAEDGSHDARCHEKVTLQKVTLQKVTLVGCVWSLRLAENSISVENSIVVENSKLSSSPVLQYTAAGCPL